ncbi:YIP1 family protein [Thermodesulfobacteriota bacterium]
MKTFIIRLFRAAKLDTEFYEEVVVDSEYLIQSICVIILYSLATGIGNYASTGLPGFILGTIIALISWLLYAYLTFYIANQLLEIKETRVDIGELLRITGFASAPGLIRIFGLIPGLFNIVFLISGIWMLLTMIAAVKQAYELELPRAAGVCLAGWIIQAVMLGFFLG